MWFLPRGHGKSTVIDFNYLSWLIGNYPDIHVNIVTKTASLSEEILLALITRFESDEKFIEIFGELKPKNTAKWTTKELIVNRREISKNPTIKATGLMGPQTGGRSDLIICDDIIDEENVRTPLQFEKVLTWHNKVLSPTLYPWGGEIVIGTRWHYADLYAELMKQYPYTIKKAIINEDTQEVLWKDYWSYPKLIEKRKEIGTIIFECLVEGSMVLTQKGYMPIEQIHIGEKVMTHKGQWQTVEAIHSEQPQEPIYSITVYGDPEPLKLTASHKLLSFKSRKYKSKRLAPHHQNISQSVKGWLEKAFDWHQAKDLEKSDFLITPINREIIPPQLYNDRDFWWMVGLYLADGCLNYSNGRISFSLNNDLALISRLERAIHKYVTKASIRRKGKLVVVDFSSKEIFTFLKNFGRYSYGKHLTLEALQLPPELQYELCQGYIHGNGCQIKGRQAISISSVNLPLLREIKQLLLRQNIVGYIALTTLARERQIQGRTIQQRTQYVLKINTKPSRHRPAEIYGDYLYSRIRKISTTEPPNTSLQPTSSN